MSTLTDYPLLLFVVSLAVFWGCAQLGAALRRKQEAHGEQAPEIFTIVLTASLTLLGLIIGFSFSMAVSRYDQRKNYEENEANAIGTGYVRTAAIAQPGPVTALAAAGMNDVLNTQGYTQAAWWNRIPGAAWLLMLLIALLCNVMVGYAARGGTVRTLLLTIMPLLISTAFLLIADIDSPRGGVIRVTPQNLVSLSQQLR
ncbi:MAG: hypothetical protein ACTHL7_01220 [Steroidobacteraceae bacterium]